MIFSHSLKQYVNKCKYFLKIKLFMFKERQNQKIKTKILSRIPSNIYFNNKLKLLNDEFKKLQSEQ